MSELRAMLKKHEGLKLKPYRCPAGKLTIGYGHNIEDKGISKRIAELILGEDLKEAMQELLRVMPAALLVSEPRQNVLISMMFNLGTDKFLEFKKMIQAVEDRDFNKAADEMLDSKWARQVKSRADELAAMMREG